MAASPQVTRWATEARVASRKYGIPANILLGLVQIESGGNEGETSSANASGLTQFIPGTAKQYNVNTAPGHAFSQIEGAAKYLKALGFTKNPTLALASYNAGPGNPGAGMGYARNVLAAAKLYTGVVGGAAPSMPGAVKAPAAPKITTTTSISDPNAAARGATIRDFLFNKGSDPLSFAQQVKGLQPITTTTRTATPPTPTAPKASPTATPVSTSALPKGVAKFKGATVAAWIAPILQYAASKGWNGVVNSGFRTLADQTRIYNSGVRPAAKPGTSNHEFTAFPGGAVDVSDAAQLSQILRGSKYAHLLVWAGSKDQVHFSHPHNGSY